MGDSQKNQFLQNINRDFEEREAQDRARKLGIGYVNLAKFTPNVDFLDLLSKEEVLESEVFPLDINGKHVKVAVTDPKKEATAKIIEDLKNHFEVEVFLCSKHSFTETVPVYDSELRQKKSMINKPVFSQENQEQNQTNFKKAIENFGQLKEKINTLPAQNAFEEIKRMALELKASDIHIQPFADHTLLRFRVDGILYDIFEIDFNQSQKLIRRIKYEGGMKSNITNIPQDGHIDFIYQNRKINLRVSALPTPFLESIVIRILDAGKGIMTLEQLGFTALQEEKIKRQYSKSQGMILVTGPTGSGKTTTLYALLSALNTSERKIITLEDPIEYKLEGVSQSQINPAENYTFETGFESLLRHDPDIILVGEIRNKKTAHLACEASMTGHMVLSSLHTNSAIESIARLRNLGIENFNIAPSINLVIAQRLIRKIHPDRCQSVALPNDARVKRALKRIQEVFPDKEIPETIPKEKKTQGVGSAYEGRIAIGEVLLFNEVLQNMIIGHKSTLDIENFLKAKTDFLTLFESGVLKVLEGQTTLEEVYRVIG